MIRQENHDDHIFLDVRQAEAGLFAVWIAGRPENHGALSPTLMTLLYLPANAEIATKQTTARLRRTFALMHSPVETLEALLEVRHALPLDQPNRCF